MFMSLMVPGDAGINRPHEPDREDQTAIEAVLDSGHPQRPVPHVVPGEQQPGRRRHHHRDPVKEDDVRNPEATALAAMRAPSDARIRA